MRSGWQWVAVTGAAMAGQFLGAEISLGQSRWEGTFGITGQTLGTLAAPAQSGIGLDSWTTGPLVGAQIGASMNRMASLDLGLQATPISARRPGEEVTGWAFSPSLTARMRFGETGWVTPTASLGLFRTVTGGLQSAGTATALRGEVADRIRATGAMLGLGAEANLIGGVRLGAEVGGRYTRFDLGNDHRLEPTIKATLGFTLFGRPERRRVQMMRFSGEPPMPPEAMMAPMLPDGEHFRIERDELRRQGAEMRRQGDEMRRRGAEVRREFRLRVPEGGDGHGFRFKVPDGEGADGRAFQFSFPGGIEGLPEEILRALPPGSVIDLDSLQGEDGARIYRFNGPDGDGSFRWTDSTSADGARIYRFERRHSLDTGSGDRQRRRQIEVRRRRRAPAAPGSPPPSPPSPPSVAPLPAPPLPPARRRN